MTVKVTPKMRKRIDAMKRKRELVTDQSHKDIHKKNLIYESPNGGETIYRAEIDLSSDSTAHVYKPVHDDVSGVRIDKPDQLEFDFNDKEEVEEVVLEMQAKISQIAILLGEVTEGIWKLRDNN